ncbi:MAG: flagellar basal body-associated FliL family protein [Thermodesulfobacteriota bacterium]
MAKEKDKESQAPEKQPGSKKKIFLLAVPLLVLVLAAGGGAFYFLAEGSASGATESDSGQEEEKKEMGPLVEMEDFVVNITHKDSTRFLKLGVTLEAKDDQSKKEIEKRMPQIRDAVLLLVGNKKYDDLKDLQGKKQLKADLTSRIRSLSGEDEVSELYFTDFVVQ